MKTIEQLKKLQEQNVELVEETQHFKNCWIEELSLRKNLEQQNKELLAFIKNIEDTNLDDLLDYKIPELLKLFEGEI